MVADTPCLAVVFHTGAISAALRQTAVRWYATQTHRVVHWVTSTAGNSPLLLAYSMAGTVDASAGRLHASQTKRHPSVFADAIGRFVINLYAYSVVRAFLSLTVWRRSGDTFETIRSVPLVADAYRLVVPHNASTAIRARDL